MEHMMQSPTEYRRSQIVLHWLMFLLFVIALATIEWRENVPRDGGQDLRNTLRAIHVSAGLLVFLLACARTTIRIRMGAPAILGEAAWQRASAHLLHWVLYAVMFALPISGLIFSQAGGREVAFFGLALPQMVAENPDLRTWVKEVHELLGNAIYALVGIHIAASLWHHIVLKDETLLRMRPGYRARR
jgi:cytochrome b561